jgi:hypothetical protein
VFALSYLRAGSCKGKTARFVRRRRCWRFASSRHCLSNLAEETLSATLVLRSMLIPYSVPLTRQYGERPAFGETRANAIGISPQGQAQRRRRIVSCDRCIGMECRQVDLTSVLIRNNLFLARPPSTGCGRATIQDRPLIHRLAPVMDARRPRLGVVGYTASRSSIFSSPYRAISRATP